MAAHLATLLLCVILLPEKFLKNALVDAFLSLRTSRDYFRPPPPKF